MRKSLRLAAIAVTTLVIGGISSAQAGNENQIVARGDCSFQANQNVKCDYQWQHGDVTVRRGSTLTITDTVTPAELGGHTFTIVKASDVPKNIVEVFAGCSPDPSSPNQGCAAAGGHFATDPPTDVLNVGPAGLDQPGDSLLVPQGGSISAKVTAARGTTLHFICVFHPWMQGTIQVD